MKQRDIVGILLYISLYLGLNLGLGYIPMKYFTFLGKLIAFHQLPESIRLLFLVVIQELLLLFILLLCFVFVHKGLSKQLISKMIFYFQSQFRWSGRKNFYKYVIGIFFMYFFLSGILISIIMYFHLTIPGFYGQQNVATLLSNIEVNGYGDYFIVIIIVSVIGPLVEEIIYRGYIANTLITKGGAFLGIVSSSFIFTFVHFEWEVFGNIFILSLFLTYVYYKTNSLIYSFLFHFMINFLAILVVLSV